MRITELHVENFMGVEAVDVTPNEGVVTIGGRNGQGKSSVLNAIVATLGGGKAVPDVALRSGARKGESTVRIERPDGDLIVRRTYGEGGRTTLTVTTADGVPVKRPQELLDSLVGSIGFDPHAFVRLQAAKQAEQLRELVGIDFSMLDENRAELYAERTAVNRDVKQQQSLVDSCPHHVDAPAAEVSVSELVEELRRREDSNREITGTEQRIAAAEKQADGLIDDAKTLRDRIKNLQEELAGVEEQTRDWESTAAELRKERKNMTASDVDSVRQQIATAETTNAKVRANKARAVAVVKLSESKAHADELTSQIEEIDAAKARSLATAPWPVEGLGFDESGGVTFNGRPFAQACSAEQLRVSLAMGMALNPQLRVLIIRDGSLIDDDTMGVIRESVEGGGFQLFLEKVSKDGAGCTLVISEGRVLETCEV